MVEWKQFSNHFSVIIIETVTDQANYSCLLCVVNTSSPSSFFPQRNFDVLVANKLKNVKIELNNTHRTTNLYHDVKLTNKRILN